MRLEKAILSVLTPDLLTREWKAKIKPSDHPLRGYCYVVAEVVYHLEAKERGYTPCFLRMPEERGTHWFLRKGSKVLDPTAAQFKTPRAYDEGKGCGFLTKKPSKRAQVVIQRIKERGLYPCAL